MNQMLPIKIRVIFVLASCVMSLTGAAEPTLRWQIALKDRGAFLIVGNLTKGTEENKVINVEGLSYTKKKMFAKRILQCAAIDANKEPLNKATATEMDVLVQVVKGEGPEMPDTIMVGEGEGIFVAIDEGVNPGKTEVIARVMPKEIFAFVKNWARELEIKARNLEEAANFIGDQLEVKP